MGSEVCHHKPTVFFLVHITVLSSKSDSCLWGLSPHKLCVESCPRFRSLVVSHIRTMRHDRPRSMTSGDQGTTLSVLLCAVGSGRENEVAYLRSQGTVVQQNLLKLLGDNEVLRQAVSSEGSAVKTSPVGNPVGFARTSPAPGDQESASQRSHAGGLALWIQTQ